MTKTKLDAALLAAAPSASAPKPETFETLWENFGAGTRHVQANARLVLIAGKEWKTAQKINNLVQSWDSIPHVLGMIHRMHEDGGLGPLRKLGMTAEQEDQFNILCREIRTKLSNTAIVSGVTEQRTTLTKQIHDQIVANHF